MAVPFGSLRVSSHCQSSGSFESYISKATLCIRSLFFFLYLRTASICASLVFLVMISYFQHSPNNYLQWLELLYTSGNGSSSWVRVLQGSSSKVRPHGVRAFQVRFLGFVPTGFVRPIVADTSLQRVPLRVRGSSVVTSLIAPTCSRQRGIIHPVRPFCLPSSGLILSSAAGSVMLSRRMVPSSCFITSRSRVGLNQVIPDIYERCSASS